MAIAQFLSTQAFTAAPDVTPNSFQNIYLLSDDDDEIEDDQEDALDLDESEEDEFDLYGF
jgi:hypothetical protein